MPIFGGGGGGGGFPPQNDIPDVRWGTDSRKILKPILLVPPLTYPSEFPPSDAILGRYNTNVDIIFAPIRDPEKNMLLLKRLRFFVEGSRTVLIRVYTKGNTPKDDNTDAPDWSIETTLSTGDNIINTSHLLSESFVVRLTWAYNTQSGGGVIFGGTPREMTEVVLEPFIILRFLVDIERYGEKGVVVGNED